MAAHRSAGSCGELARSRISRLSRPARGGRPLPPCSETAGYRWRSRLGRGGRVCCAGTAKPGHRGSEPDNSAGFFTSDISARNLCISKTVVFETIATLRRVELLGWLTDVLKRMFQVDQGPRARAAAAV